MPTGERSRTATALLAALAPLAALALGACDPWSLTAGAGATAGVALAEERPIGQVVEDSAIQLGINRRWFDRDPSWLTQLSSTVTEGRVLLTGQVTDPQIPVEAIRAVWQVEGVREVINEISVTRDEGVSGMARDVWISTQLRSRLTFDTTIRSINYSIETVGGTVYLMGIAQDPAERERVVAHARQIPYVRRVVDYTRLSGAPAA